MAQLGTIHDAVLGHLLKVGGVCKFTILAESITK